MSIMTTTRTPTTVLAIVVVLAGFSTAGSIASATGASAQSMKAKAPTISRSLQATMRKQRGNARFMSQARGAGDEIDECMNNPSNAHIDYIERLGGCFCLSIDNALEGCQSAD